MQSIIKFEIQDRMNLDQCINAWLKAKADRSKSENTHRAYQDTIESFRDLLKMYGKDLDSQSEIIAPIAQSWAGENVTASTYNQR